MSLGGSKPYTEKKIGEKSFLREFSVELDADELSWHRDDEDREVEIISGKNWQFQYDDCLPVTVEPGDRVFVERHEWHRIIKGDTNLKLIIHK